MSFNNDNELFKASNKGWWSFIDFFNKGKSGNDTWGDH